MIGFIGTSLQLQSIMTAHNQWLPKTRSIPYWTTSVFSSTVTVLVLIYESVTSSASVVRWLALHSGTLNLLNCRLHYLTNESMTELNSSQSQSQSYIATDGRSINKSWCRAPSRAHDQIFIIIWQLRSCFCGASSLTRGRVCLLFMLPALASAVFLWSESLGTSDHILLSQIW
jgi:hypothetical protein